MTDRVRTLTVTLDRDMRDDDVQAVVEAIRMVKCVGDVQLGPVVDSFTHDARMAFRREVGDVLNRVIHLAIWSSGSEAWQNIRHELDKSGN